MFNSILFLLLFILKKTQFVWLLCFKNLKCYHYRIDIPKTSAYDPADSNRKLFYVHPLQSLAAGCFGFR